MNLDLVNSKLEFHEECYTGYTRYMPRYISFNGKRVNLKYKNIFRRRKRNTQKRRLIIQSYKYGPAQIMDRPNPIATFRPSITSESSGKAPSSRLP